MFFNINNYTYCVKVTARRKVSHLSQPKNISFLQLVTATREDDLKTAEEAVTEGKTVLLFNNKSFKLDPSTYQVMSVGITRNPNYIGVEILRQELYSIAM